MCDKCLEYPCGDSHGSCHEDQDSDGKCDFCGAEMSAELFDSDCDKFCDRCGMSLCSDGYIPHEDKNTDGCCDMCLLPS